MPGELPPAHRLLQAVCWPGHGVLLHRGRVTLASGDDAVLRRLQRTLPALADGDVVTRRLDEALVVCARRRGDHALALAMPASIDATVVHEKLARALAIFARPVESTWTPSGGHGSGGASGAPAEVWAARVRPRPS